MTGAGGIVEVQGTAETVAFSQESFDQLMALAKKGIGELVALQKLTVVVAWHWQCLALSPLIRNDPAGILETVLYARDLGAIEDFYRRALGLEPFAKAEGRHVFYRLGEQVLLIFNPDATKPPADDAEAPGAAARRRRRGPRVLPRHAPTRSPPGARTSRSKASPSRPTSNGPRAAARSISATPPAIAWSSPSRASGVSREAMTRRLQRGDRLVVATHNPGKVWEINKLIEPYGLAAVSAGELGLTEPEETETTFEGNAKLKALFAAKGSGLPALADDSGIEIDALGGAPGVYTADWAGPQRDFSIAMQRVHDELSSGRPGRASRYAPTSSRVLCLAWPDGETQLFEGKVYGHVVWPPRGGNGFGYDPIFVADGQEQTFGEMEPASKICHLAPNPRLRPFQAGLPRSATSAR